jgi:hypothetical protein
LALARAGIGNLATPLAFMAVEQIQVYRLQALTIDEDDEIRVVFICALTIE